jgi:hypothetical protein
MFDMQFKYATLTAPRNYHCFCHILSIASSYPTWDIGSHNALLISAEVVMGFRATMSAASAQKKECKPLRQVEQIFMACGPFLFY